MINFKTISYKNFQAVGNTAITIDLQRSPTTMISGKNGAGKSNTLEALSYVLFGKTLKKVNLSGLINTINKKALLVTVEFDIKGKEYKIVRGQKPSILEFWIDNELQDQSASSRDYQAKIEHALGMDHKMFTQIVVLNKEKYVPFLELSATERRKVVEDILDISVFSEMSEILKNDIKEANNTQNNIKFEYSRLDTQLEGVQRLVLESNNNVQGEIDSLKKQIEEDQKELIKVEDQIDLEQQRVPDISQTKKQISELDNKINAARNLSAKAKVTADNTKKFMKDVISSETCPHCTQSIDDNFKTEKLLECTKALQTAEGNIEHISGAVDTWTAEKRKLEQNLQEVYAIERTIATFKATAQQLNSNIRRAMQSVVERSKKLQNNDYTQELQELETKLSEKESELNKQIEVCNNLNKCRLLLKDDAIKASVVSEYIEFINSRVNDYLNAMEFYINIQLDENFNDSIKSVNREGFTYENLSTGQKCRVSLAICLALLEVASLKNSVVTNIIFLDEILEPFDAEGVSLFMKLVNDKLSKKNVFVVTQRAAEFSSYFKNELKFELVDGFTQISM